MGREPGAQAWRNFLGNDWQPEIDLCDFILPNVAPYSGASEFLAQPTRRTLAVRDRVASCGVAAAMTNARRVALERGNV